LLRNFTLIFVCGLSIRRCGHERSGEKLKEISSHVMTFGGFVVSGGE
jgi:hypothetical protein